jgi:hypothetical protein
MGAMRPASDMRAQILKNLLFSRVLVFAEKTRGAGSSRGTYPSRQTETCLVILFRCYPDPKTGGVETFMLACVGLERVMGRALCAISPMVRRARSGIGGTGR